MEPIDHVTRWCTEKIEN